MSSRRATSISMSLAITPMIDVVFLLLVFFICTVHFERSEEVFVMDLPSRGATADPLALRDPPITIEVAARTEAGCALAIHAEGVGANPTSFDELSAVLKGLRRTKDHEGLYESTHQVLIAPSRAAQWQDSVDAFNAAVRAGFANIGFRESHP